MIEFFAQPSIHFKNGEVFIATASFDEIDSKKYFCVPNCILEECKDYFQKNMLLLDHSDLEKNKICFYFSNKLKIPLSNIWVDSSVEYYVNTICENQLNVFYNQTDILLNVKDNGYMKIFNQKNRKVTAIVEDNEIVALADDNANGAITVGTNERYRNKGYSTKCLAKLIYEYKQKYQELCFPTTMDNIAAIKVAVKCGMIRKASGYWIRVNSKDGEILFNSKTELFEKLP